MRTGRQALVAGVFLLLLAGCGLDPDMRNNRFDTSESAQEARTSGTAPDAGNAAPDDRASSTEEDLDIATIAGNAIDSVDVAEPPSLADTIVGEDDGTHLARHRVERGQTAQSIAEFYRVNPRDLAAWNRLGPDFAVLEGQILEIYLPPLEQVTEAADTTDTAAVSAAPAAVETPALVATNAGSAVSPTAPVDEAASENAAALLARDSAPASDESEVNIEENVLPTLEQLDSDQSQSAQPDWETGGAMILPVQGNIIRPYIAGETDGIDIRSSAGTAVRAADNGTVGAVTTESDDNTQIIIIKHKGSLLSVYMQVTDLAVAKGDQVARGDVIANVAATSDAEPAFLRFQVREGFDSVDPWNYLQ